MRSLPLGPLMVDVGGTRLSGSEKLFLSQPAVGAVILFSRNFVSRTQVADLIAEIKSLRTPSLLIAVDQEGGRVQRFKQGFCTLPAVNRFGICYGHNPELALKLSRSAGYLMAAELVEIGVDFSFAPVLDCADMASTVIGDRGFHQDPEAIVALAGAFIDGMAEAGMAATGKHFPGHGGVIDDSHLKVPVDNRSLEELQRCDLIPYKRLATRLGGVMTAHVQFPKIAQDLPTYSSFWLNHVLRQEIGFDGIIFSDDLSMKGAHVGGQALQRTHLALEAGCDMALICNDPESAEKVVDTLGNSVQVNQQRLESMRATGLDAAVDTAALRQQLDQLV